MDITSDASRVVYDAENALQNSDLARFSREIESLKNQLAENAEKLNDLQVELAKQGGQVEAYSRAHESIFRTLELGYSTTLTWYTVVIALGGLLGLFLIVMYKKREVDQMADRVQEQFNEKLKEPEVVATYIAAALETEKHQASLSRLKTEVFEELRSDIMDWLEDDRSTNVNDDEDEAGIVEEFRRATSSEENKRGSNDGS